MKIFLTHSQTVLLGISNKDCINEHIRPYSLPKSSTVENKMEKKPSAFTVMIKI